MGNQPAQQQGKEMKVGMAFCTSSLLPAGGARWAGLGAGVSTPILSGRGVGWVLASPVAGGGPAVWVMGRGAGCLRKDLERFLASHRKGVFLGTWGGNFPPRKGEKLQVVTGL
jgi:hypothetical protein